MSKNKMTASELWDKKYKCSYLLPDPGGGVVRELIEELRCLGKREPRKDATNEPSELAAWLYKQFAFIQAKDVERTIRLDRMKVMEIYEELRRLEEYEENYKYCDADIDLLNDRIAKLEDEALALHKAGSDGYEEQQERIAELEKRIDELNEVGRVAFQIGSLPSHRLSNSEIEEYGEAREMLAKDWNTKAPADDQV